ncbi:hypothetical protein GW17_00037738 [Ensete ventricosum]|nr:hypothetical protein GW17_00037738 [Ensete ventricosum]
MAREGENANANGRPERCMEEGAAGDGRKESVNPDHGYASSADKGCRLSLSVPFLQKILAEIFGTYFLIFAGCASVTVNLSKGMITFPGICVVWGLAVMVMVYSVGHISGAHFNPAVTIAFATCGRFPWKQVSDSSIRHHNHSTGLSLTSRFFGVGAGASLRFCSATGRDAGERHAAFDVRGEARALPGDDTGRIGRAVACSRVHHLLLPDVCDLGSGHRQQSSKYGEQSRTHRFRADSKPAISYCSDRRIGGVSSGSYNLIECAHRRVGKTTNPLSPS